MKKEEFLSELDARLSALPNMDKKRSLDYYNEMIEDQMEDGISEEDAIQKIGTPAMAAAQIMQELPLITLARTRINAHGSARTTTLIIAGAPSWISLLAVAFSLLVSVIAVFFSALVVFFSLFVALWAVDLSFAIGALAGVVLSLLELFSGGLFLYSIFLLGAALMLAALSIFTYYGAIYSTRGLIYLSRCVIKLYGLIFKFIKS